MKSLIALISLFFGLQAFSAHIVSVDKKANIAIDLKLRKINEEIIIDPSVENMIVQWGEKTIKFQTMNTFLKTDRYNKHIFSKDGNHFISVNLQKRDSRHYYSIITYRNLNNNKLLQYRGLVEFKSEQKSNNVLLGYQKSQMK
ncbi:MAG: hypothetical protein H6620_06005 [Halobacteriovoraceae bacterium]|nr:hypothetical protein [Halobacteriovoraceae bacterium]